MKSEFDADCDAWLKSLGPEVNEWLKHVLAVPGPLPNLSIEGPPGSGMKLLQDGLDGLSN